MDQISNRIHKIEVLLKALNEETDTRIKALEIALARQEAINAALLDFMKRFSESPEVSRLRVGSSKFFMNIISALTPPVKEQELDP